MDALAPRADEGRGMTAKSPGELSSKLSRGFPNEATHPSLKDTASLTHKLDGGKRGK